MKTNKKVVLGFAVAMVFSLAFMQGNSMQNNRGDVNVQQVGIGAGYMAGSSELGAAGAWGAASAYSLWASGHVATGGTILGWNPAGWAMWGGAAGLLL